MIGPTFDILVPTVTQRHGRVRPLLMALSRQALAFDGQVRVLVYRDNFDVSIGAKRNALLDAAQADFVAFIDDDDRVSTTYVDQIMAALQEDPDQVGFKLRYTIDGHVQPPCYHGLRWPVWTQDAEGFYRPTTHLNPMRRSIAAAFRFPDLSWTEDSQWVHQVFHSGLLQQEVYIDDFLYFYDHVPSESLTNLVHRHPVFGSPAFYQMPLVTYLPESA